MDVGVLGETEVRTSQGPLGLTSRKLRQIVSGLAVARGRTVSYDALVDLLWGDRPPDGLPGTLHAYVATLRKMLEPDRAPRAPARVLVTVGVGYALRLPDGGLDADRFATVVADVARRLERPDPLARPELAEEELARAEADLLDALGLWRGEPYADLDDRDPVVAERARLTELHVLAHESRATLLLARGAHAEAAAELEVLTAAHPLRERLWVMRAQALQAVGRQADALAALREVATLLDDELGLEPSPVLRDLEQRILRQDPALSWARASAGARPEPVAPPPAPPHDPPQRRRPRLPDWPLTGRRAELAALVDLVDQAEQGRPGFAAVTGEPGIGKSRLCGEAAAVAVDRGARLLVGRCSQDDGAPPLWPWQQVLRGVGRDLEVDAAADEGAGFRTWEAVVSQLVEAASEELLVIVVDDLHWADLPTLRVMRLLVEQATGRLLVLTTWREHPAPAGALADVAEALARAHAVRLPLAGLEPAEAADLVAAVGAGAPTPEEAGELARRTDGNPFYVVEFARLTHGSGLGELLTSASTPQAVQDVVARRIAQLPDRAVATVKAAGVVGRSFDLASVVAAAGGPATEDEVLDDLDVAVAAGLLREDAAERWSFGHALVRDVAYARLGASRAARAHGRVATLLDEVGGRASEAARHWRAAGPAHARRAWQSASTAAREARRLHAHEEAAQLLRDALVTMEADAAADDRERARLLLDLAEAERWSGQWRRLREASESALSLAEGLGDLDLVAEAASAMTVGAFWQTTSYNETHHRQVAALRRVLAELPAEDSRDRCLLLSSLAVELYYVAGHDERAALVEEALAMARRLDDETLVVDTCLKGFVATWRPETAPDRLLLVDRASRLSERSGDPQRLVVAHTLRAVCLGELGRVDEMWEAVAVARARAEQLRIPYGTVVLDGLVVPWLAMAGRREEALAALERMQESSRRVTLFQDSEAILGAHLSLQTWCGAVGDLLETLVQMDAEGPLPTTTAVLQAMIRSGDVERARRYRDEHPVRLLDSDWYTPLLLAGAAESALWLGDGDLGARTYRRLAPLAGRTACAGSGVAQGPVDAYLAMAAAAAGERETASRHADDALALMDLWQIPRCAAWFVRVRHHHDF